MLGKLIFLPNDEGVYIEARLQREYHEWKEVQVVAVALTDSITTTAATTTVALASITSLAYL